MTANVDASSPPAKLSPTERLARKRAAARLRQQRCRARKRQAVLEKKREESERRQVQITQDSRPMTSQNTPAARAPVFSIHRPKDGERWINGTTPPRPIYKCVSFESQRSYESQRSSPPRNSPEKTLIVSLTPTSSPTKPLEVISIPNDKPEETLVPEEEAAVAAMLSLKTGSEESPKQSKHVPPSPIGKSRASHTAKYRYYTRGWEPRRFGTYEYRRQPRVPDFYKMPMPIAPHSYRGYYPSFPRYARYDYE